VRLAPGRLAARRDKVICLAEDESRTPIGIAQSDCRQHIHVLGPTGSGKSTLLLNLALDDILAGRGVGVIDPKGDLVQALLERIPPSESDRVVLIDPAQRELPVGFNVLACDDSDLHEVVCDHVVTIFKKTYERFWGPRTDDLLRAAILTLLQKPGSTLCEVPLLLLQPEVRQWFIEDLDDPVGLEPFWKEFGAMSEGQRLQVVGPLLNKLRTFLLRRTVRNMLGQSHSTIGMDEVLDNQCILLVSLAKGLLGEETSQLLGSFLVARIWQAATARAGRPESWRADFSLYVDEFQNYLHLPQSLDDVLAEARGYHLGLVLANQHLGQLSTTTREALGSNARTRVIFQCGQDDARYLAREFGPQLGERELRSLRHFQVAVRLCVDGHIEPPFTGITRDAPAGLGDEHAARLMRRSLERWGRPRPTVEAEIRSRLEAEGFSHPDQAVGG
ncbi:MAG: type IV secretory system conjugative DNA transfer family protein, partial [Thermoplasmata archaeon]